MPQPTEGVMMKIRSLSFLLLGAVIAAAPAAAQMPPLDNTNRRAPLDRLEELAEVKRVVDRFGRMWEDEDMESFANVIAQDATIMIIGTDSAEQWVGYEAYRDARQRQYDSFENVEFNVYDQEIALSESGTVAWFFERFDLFTIAQGDPVSVEGVRLTGVLEKRRGY